MGSMDELTKWKKKFCAILTKNSCYNYNFLKNMLTLLFNGVKL